MRAVLLVHFPVCPACAFVLGRELVVFLAIGHAIGRDKFYVHLELLPGIRCAFIRLVLAGTLLLFGRPQLRGRSLEAAVASDVAALLRLFIAQQQIARVLFAYRCTSWISQSLCFRGECSGARLRFFSDSTVPSYRRFHLWTVLRLILYRSAAFVTPCFAAYFNTR